MFLGSTQGIAIIENLMEHLAKACQEDPLEFRLKNLNASGTDEAKALRKIIDEVRQSSDFDRRLAEVSKNKVWFLDIYIYRLSSKRLRNSIAITGGKNEE